MNPFRKVRAGEPLSISASAWNAVIDEVATRPQLDGGTSRDPHVNFRVRCQNNSGTGVSKWSILQITGVRPAPSGTYTEFESWPSVIGVRPGAGVNAIDPKCVVAVEPIPDQGFGQAAIAGVVQCRLNVNCTGHQYATTAENESDYLETSSVGPFRILWRDNPPATGTQKPFGLVMFAADSPLRSAEGYTTGAVQLLGHEQSSGSTGCYSYLRWYSVSECTGPQSFAASYFL